MGFEYSLVASKIWGGNPVIPDGPAKASPLWKKVYDTLRGLRDATLATLVWSGDFAVEGSAANNFTVTIGAISCITLLDASSHNLPFAYAGGTIDQTKIQGGGGTLGAAIDWWYVYAYLNGSSLDWEISQTAPTGNLMFKTGDNTRRFIGCFRTNSSGVPLAVRAKHGVYTYRHERSVYLASWGTATSTTNETVTSGSGEEPYVPDYARVAHMAFEFAHGTDTNTRTCNIFAGGDTTTAAFSIIAPNIGGANYIDRMTADVELDGSRRFAYFIDASTGGPTLAAFCRGWR